MSSATSPTSLVPTSLLSKTRKNSRHAVQEPIARGPSIAAVAPEVASRVWIDLDDASDDDDARTNGLAEAKRRRLQGEKGKQPVDEHDVALIAERRTSVVSLTAKDDSDDDSQDLCVICLQAVRDATIVGECGHQIFCFECINVWANQSRKCPLCTRAMAPFLLHELDSPTGPTKFYLPPLPSIRPTPATASSSLTTHHHRHRRPSFLAYSDRHGLHGRPSDIWARVKRDSQGVAEEDLLERAVERRREVYRYGLYVKHIASNGFTRFKPSPSPSQFAENKETIARATSFIRRELRVWRHLDVEFLTTYIISLMKSIDIRSEPAVRLLADFLDARGSTGRERRGAEQFAHEVYSFLRSPYRDLAIYDAIAQYDPVPAETSDSESEGEVPVRGLSVGQAEASSRRSRSRSHASTDSSIRSISPPPRKRARLSPRRWNKADSYIVPAPRSEGRPWNRRDSWVNHEVAAVEAKRVRREASPVQEETVIIPERAVVHRGMRGWGETADSADGPMDVRNGVPSPPSEKEQVQKEEPVKPSLELRIFGIGRNAEDKMRAVPVPPKVSYDSDDEDLALESAIWAVDGGQGDEASAVVQPGGDQPQPSLEAPRIANKEKLLARLMREKMKHAPTAEEHPSPMDREAAPSAVQKPADTTAVEAEAKTKARLQLKLRLEREKAAAHAREKQEDAVNGSGAANDRAAVLRAKLLEKKMATSQVVR